MTQRLYKAYTRIQDAQPHVQTFIALNKYINKDSDKIIQRKLKGENYDFPFYIHDTLLSHADSEDPKVKHMTLESLKWELYYMDKYFPQAKLVVHYIPELYEEYKDNPKILWENEEKYPDSLNANNLCLDTAHAFTMGKSLDQIVELAKKAKLIHFNGVKEDKKTHAKPGSKQDIIFRDPKYIKQILDIDTDKIAEW